MKDMIRELAALEAKATPGPWEIEPPTMAGNERPIIGAYGIGSICALSMRGAPHYQANLPADDPLYQPSALVVMEANAALIVAMRNALPKVLQYIEQLEATINSWEIRFAGGTDDVRQQRSRAEKAEAERDVLIDNFHVDDCLVERGYNAPSWCQSEDQCGDWTCDFGVANCWRKWAAQETVKREGGGE